MARSGDFQYWLGNKGLRHKFAIHFLWEKPPQARFPDIYSGDKKFNSRPVAPTILCVSHSQQDVPFGVRAVDLRELLQDVVQHVEVGVAMEFRSIIGRGKLVASFWLPGLTQLQ